MAATYYGMNPPFIGGAENVMSRQEDERLIKNDILQLLLTVPGERVMRPDFGVNLRNFVFEQLTASSISQLKAEIENQIGIYEKRVSIDYIDISKNDDENYLNIKIAVRLKRDPKRYFTIEQFING